MIQVRAVARNKGLPGSCRVSMDWQRTPSVHEVRESMRLTRHAVICAALVVFTGGVARGETIRIVEPEADEILYGKTRVVVEVDSPDTVRSVRFFLDRLAQPVCVSSTAPFTCEFDSGTGFQGRLIRAVALDGSGLQIGEDRVETLAFPAPVEVTRRVITVPVVVSHEGDEPIDLEGVELACHYVREPCEVIEVSRLGEVQRAPMSIEVLVDVSGSVTVQRDKLFEAMEAMIAAFPDSADLAITEFGDLYRRLGEFTRDRDALQAQMRKLSINQSRTCLLRAIDHSLAALAERPGHKVLFILSDGFETCDASFTGPRAGRSHRVNNGALLRVVDMARDVNVQIYIFRQEVMFTRFDRSYEGIARETGGRLFATGDVYGIARSFDDLIGDLRSTWLLDIILPQDVAPGPARRLWLEAPEETELSLRYPEYWDAGSTEEARIAYADAELGEARLWAAEGLRGSRNPRALRALVEVLAIEPDERLRTEQLLSIYNITAHLLLHGDSAQQKAALDAVAALSELNPDYLDRLQPALRVYQNVDTLDRYKRRAAPFASPR